MSNIQRNQSLFNIPSYTPQQTPSSTRDDVQRAQEHSSSLISRLTSSVRNLFSSIRNRHGESRRQHAEQGKSPATDDNVSDKEPMALPPTILFPAFDAPVIKDLIPVPPSITFPEFEAVYTGIHEFPDDILPNANYIDQLLVSLDKCKQAIQPAPTYNTEGKMFFFPEETDTVIDPGHESIQGLLKLDPRNPTKFIMEVTTAIENPVSYEHLISSYKAMKYGLTHSLVRSISQHSEAIRNLAVIHDDHVSRLKSSKELLLIQSGNMRLNAEMPALVLRAAKVVFHRSAILEVNTIRTGLGKVMKELFKQASFVSSDICNDTGTLKRASERYFNLLLAPENKLDPIYNTSNEIFLKTQASLAMGNIYSIILKHKEHTPEEHMHDVLSNFEHLAHILSTLYEDIQTPAHMFATISANYTSSVVKIKGEIAKALNMPAPRTEWFVHTLNAQFNSLPFPLTLEVIHAIEKGMNTTKEKGFLAS